MTVVNKFNVNKQVATLNLDIYDVTANNDGTTFASLSALLSSENLSTLIPSAVRRGGMSIRFVQSSDNKYVQYRLMLSTFTGAQFSNANNWQGVNQILGGIYNVSELHPTGGTGGTNVYTFNEAKAAVPTAFRTPGLIISFISEEGIVVAQYNQKEYDNTQYLYSSTEWSIINTKHFININKENNRTEPYSDAGTARGFTPKIYRSNPSGLVIAYLLSNGWHYEKCITNEWTNSVSGWENFFPDVSGFALDANVLKTTANQNLNETKKQNALDNLGLGTVREKILDIPEGSTFYNVSASITTGNSRKLLVNVPIVSTEIEATIRLVGMSGFVVFSNTTTYRQCAGYHLTNGQVLGNVKIPSNCDAIFVYTEDRQSVLSDTNFSLTIVQGTIRKTSDSLSGQFSGIAPYSIWLSICDIISIGYYERSIIEVPILTSPEKKILLLRGLDAKIRFRDSSNFILEEVVANNGIEKEIVIPKGVTRIDVKYGSNVSVVTPFELQIFSGRIESYLDTDEILFFEKRYIPTGNYRNTNICLNTFTKPIKAKVTLRGFDGSIAFCNSSWHETCRYDLQNGIETEIIIPSESTYVITKKNPQEIVSADTYFSLKIIFSSNDEETEIKCDSIVDYKKYVPVFESLNLTAIEGGVPSTNYKTLVLASITDIHDEPHSAEKIIRFINKYKKYFTDVIALGDYQNGALDTPISIDQIEGWNIIIKAIGNHDAYTGWDGSHGTPTGLATEQVCYDTFIKDDVSLWNAQYTTNHCYLYKDYANQKIRMVFVDYMHWTNDQETWFTKVLNDTLDSSNTAYGYHVIVCQHMISSTADSGDFIPFDNCSFECYDKVFDGYASLNIPDIVHDFQENGGQFICHLCGHTHRAFTGVYENYPKQAIIVQPCSAAFVHHRDSVFTWDTDYMMQFYVYSFDTYKKFIRVYKVGANYNRNMQHQEAMLIQYGDTVKLLSCY